MSYLVINFITGMDTSQGGTDCLFSFPLEDRFTVISFLTVFVTCVKQELDNSAGGQIWLLAIKRNIEIVLHV